MFLLSLLGLAGKAIHENITTSPEYIAKKHPWATENQRMRMAMLDEMEEENRKRAQEMREYNRLNK